MCIFISIDFPIVHSSMTSSLSSMTPTCLQQRESYPYMFHDPLSLGSPYATHPRNSACNPATAHQQPPQHGVYGNSSVVSTSNTGRKELTIPIKIDPSKPDLPLAGVISAGVSVPVQISTQNVSDLTGSNYWPRLQWSSIFNLPTKLFYKASKESAINAVTDLAVKQQEQQSRDSPPTILSLIAPSSISDSYSSQPHAFQILDWNRVGIGQPNICMSQQTWNILQSTWNSLTPRIFPFPCYQMQTPWPSISEHERLWISAYEVEVLQIPLYI